MKKNASVGHAGPNFELGQIWQTPKGALWLVVEKPLARQTILRKGKEGTGRIIYQTRPCKTWKLWDPQNDNDGVKTWKIEVIVETENDYDRHSIIEQIDRDLNRGDGIYMRIETAVIMPFTGDEA